MHYEKVERDFIKRTLKIIEQYDSYIESLPNSQTNSENFDITLLVNCLIGLLVVPYEYKGRKEGGKKDIVICAEGNTPINALEEGWGLQHMEIDKICGFPPRPRELDPREATLNLVVYRMRNSIAHSRWKESEDVSNSKEVSNSTLQVSLFHDFLTFLKSTIPGIGLQYKDKAGNPKESEITDLIFRDRLGGENGKVTFEAKIPVKDLKVFAIKLASTILEETP